jgi:hypothetical protein
VLYGAIWLLSVLGEHIGFRAGQKAVGLLAVFAFPFMVGFVIYGIALLIRGKRSYHVFANGFVHRRNATVWAYRWAEVAELRGRLFTEGENAGRVMDYELVPQAGKEIIVPLEVVDGRDTFVDALITGLREAGRPVV